MIGESLEQHCEIEFNKLRATGFKMHTLKKIMMRVLDQRAIIFIVN